MSMNKISSASARTGLLTRMKRIAKLLCRAVQSMMSLKNTECEHGIADQNEKMFLEPGKEKFERIFEDSLLVPFGVIL